MAQMRAGFVYGGCSIAGHAQFNKSRSVVSILPSANSHYRRPEPLASAAIGLPHAGDPIAICRVLLREVGTESDAGSFELLPVREIW